MIRLSTTCLMSEDHCLGSGFQHLVTDFHLGFGVCALLYFFSEGNDEDRHSYCNQRNQEECSQFGNGVFYFVECKAYSQIIS
ncbi:MAG: hypothetical protein ACO3MG_06390 [Saprospiraceae bacterium]